jgi:hypothetical protein
MLNSIFEKVNGFTEEAIFSDNEAGDELYIELGEEARLIWTVACMPFLSQ